MKLRLALLIVWLMLTNVAPIEAAGPVKFTVAVRSAIVRSGPATTFSVLKTVARNQTFTVVGRTADLTWLQIKVPSVNIDAWIKSTLGRVQGDVIGVPIKRTDSARVATSTSIPAITPVAPLISQTGPTTPVVAAATANARAIFQTGLALGNSASHFSKVGDCQSVSPFFMAAFDTPGDYHLGQYGYLQDTIDNFAGSFARNGLTVGNGFNTASVLSPLWANAKVCNTGESPLECEYRLRRPAFALISLGTNGAWQSDADYEAGLRKIIEISIAEGVVPILSTKADNVEGGGRFNLVMAKLAAEYDLPLWNFWLAMSSLPNFGIVDAYHLSWGRSFFDDPVSMSHGWAWRNLTALQSLDSVWKGVR